MRLRSLHPTILRNPLTRHGRMARSELRNNPRPLPTSWPGLTRPSTLSCATVCGPSWIPGSSPGMTPVGAAPSSRHRRFNCQTATALQTCVITPIVCGAGAPSWFAFPPSCERACGTPGARCTLGPDANAVFRNLECIRTFGGAEQVPDVPPAVFFRLPAHLPWRTVPSPKLMSQGGGTG
jgi:hypothetical protein